MVMIIWRIDFEFLLVGDIGDKNDWRQTSVFHLAAEDGDTAVEFVKNKMLGSEVDVTMPVSAMGIFSSPATNTISMTMVNWRLTGLTKVCVLNTIDTDALEAAGVLEYLKNDQANQNHGDESLQSDSAVSSDQAAP